MAAQLKPDAQNMVADATWLIYDHTIARGELKLLSMTEKDYRRSVFLDGRVFSSEERKYVAPFHETARLFENLDRPPARTAYIFHIGHCGSTLLSRSLSASDRVLPLREPLSFMRLAQLERELGDPVCMVSREQWERLCRLLLHSYARTFRPAQRALVKATSLNNNLIGPVLEGVPESRAILLYQPLHVFIAGLFKKTPPSSDIFNQARDRMQAWLKIPGAPKLQNWRLSPLQMAVISWLSSMHLLETALGRYPDRVELVNFEDFLGDPEAALVEIDDFLGLNQAQEHLLKHYDKVSREYSKSPGRTFTSDDREKVMHESILRNAGRIERSRKFATGLIDATPALKPLEAYLG